MVGVAPNDNGFGSDLITNGAVVVADDNTGVVNPLLDVMALFNCRTPACVNCASC